MSVEFSLRADPDRLPEPTAPKLPAFGRLMDALAIRLGRPPRSWASPGQRDWMRCAGLALSSLAKRGAFVPGYRFVVHDERPRFAWLDFALSRSAERPSPGLKRSPGINVVHVARGKPSYSVAGVRDGKLAAPLMRELAGRLESIDAARVFVAAHEFGHAWQNLHGHPFAWAAAEARGGLFASQAMANADPWRDRDEASPADECFALFEESACDAIGCWILAKEGWLGAFQAVAAFRTSRSNFESEPHRYCTQWLLCSLAAMSASLPDDFDGFQAVLAELFATKSAPIISAFERIRLTRPPSPIHRPPRRARAKLRRAAKARTSVSHSDLALDALDATV